MSPTAAELSQEEAKFVFRGKETTKKNSFFLFVCWFFLKHQQENALIIPFFQHKPFDLCKTTKTQCFGGSTSPFSIYFLIIFHSGGISGGSFYLILVCSPLVQTQVPSSN